LKPDCYAALEEKRGSKVIQRVQGVLYQKAMMIKPQSGNFWEFQTKKQTTKNPHGFRG